jgi:phage N-6-adenine-methyltransferase
MSNIAVHFSSETNEWETPDELFSVLDCYFQFTLDAAATDDNRKCKRYFTVETDGLSQSWENETVWLNPPYGREIGKWVKKAYEESLNGHTTVVMLIPSRTDTSYWHDYVMKASDIYYIRGRVKFFNKDKGGNTPAPFPSAIVVFGGWKKWIF